MTIHRGSCCWKSRENKQDEEFEEDWKLLFELYEILKKRVDAREEKMRDYVRKVGLTEKEKNKDEQQ